MSGHSKWHSIKHKKAATDAKKGKIFTKHAKMIAVAAREGGGDPEMNAALRVAIENAKAENMPNANVERAIKRGTGELGDGAQITEAMYEGYGPEGVAILVQSLTDNKNRALSSLKIIFSKNGGTLVEAGSVSWMFKKRGVITIPIADKNPEDIELSAIDAGADDVKVEDSNVEVYTEPTKLMTVKKNLENQGIRPESASIIHLAENTIRITDVEKAKKLLRLMDALEEDDDVADVFSNFDIPGEILEKCFES